MATGPTRVEKYLLHLDALGGGIEPEFRQVESTWPGHAGITAISYRDTPESGLFLGLTYGLSLAHQDEWSRGRPELSICVKSDDPVWAYAIAYLAEQLRHDCRFGYGDTVDFGEPIVSGSALDGFVVFAPSVLDQDDARVDVGDSLPIHIVGMYPTFTSERGYIKENGLEEFWKLDWDAYDVSRAPVV